MTAQAFFVTTGGAPVNLPFLTIGIEITAPAEAAWVVVTDTHLWSEWRPGIAAVEASERFIRLGTHGWLRTVSGVRVPFLVTEYQSGCRWRWRVGGIPGTAHRVEPIDPLRCRVLFEVPVHAAAALPLCRVAALRIRRLLDTGDFTGTGIVRQEA